MTILSTVPIGVAAVQAMATASPAASPRTDLTTGPCGAMARTADLPDAMTATLAVRTTAVITAGMGVLLTAVTTGPAADLAGTPIVGPAAVPPEGRMTAVMGGGKITARIGVTIGAQLTAPLIGVTTAVRMGALPTHPETATAGLHSGLRSARATGTLLLPGSATSSASAPQPVRLNRGPGLPPERCSRRFRRKPSAFWICCPKP